MALAPSRPLLSLPSRSRRRRSVAIWSSASWPRSASAISPFTAATAFRTPLPPNRPLSPSRSSTASRVPVDAPEGTAARPCAPLSRKTSTSTVGLPRQSMTSRPRTLSMVVIAHLLPSRPDPRLLVLIPVMWTSIEGSRVGRAFRHLRDPQQVRSARDAERHSARDRDRVARLGKPLAKGDRAGIVHNLGQAAELLHMHGVRAPPRGEPPRRRQVGSQAQDRSGRALARRPERGGARGRVGDERGDGQDGGAATQSITDHV